VNLGTARWARELGCLRALLVADIDRGGAFAHLHGTWALLPEDLRPALAGFVLNKFRGDAALLAPGPAQLQALTGVPLLGVLPMQRDHGLPDEDGLHALPAASARGPRIAVVAWPQLSNLDEFQPLAAAAALRWARTAAELEAADWIVLPGSKQVSGDLAWLRAQGLVEPILQHARRGRPLLGICGGLQVLGEWLDDPEGTDGEPHGPLPGLGLLPLATRHAAPKRLRAAAVRFGTLAAPWQTLSALELPAYEIRCGRTTATHGTTIHTTAIHAAASHVSAAHVTTTHAAATPALSGADGETIGWQAGNVLGIAAHGLFEDANVLRALFGTGVRTLDASFDGLADLIETHMGAATLRSLLRA
jgi:adenosylcobyric acid synthase